MPCISIVAGPNEGDYYPLGARTLVIGRDEGCPVQITDDRVSRRHVQIRLADGAYLATDMKSANGVFVNGHKIEGECALEDGDVLEVGRSKIAFWGEDLGDRESAINKWRERGERGRATVEE